MESLNSSFAPRLKDACKILSVMLGLTGMLNTSGEVYTNLPVYQPRIDHTAIYLRHPKDGLDQPLLEYNHCPDVAKFKGRYYVVWNGCTTKGENVPGQMIQLSVSEDFENWTAPVRPFFANATDQVQWQPSLINYKDEVLFCVWCTSMPEQKTFVSSTTDGMHWETKEVPTPPLFIKDNIMGFPTTHGIITNDDSIMIPCSLLSLIHLPNLALGKTYSAALLISRDSGETWSWSGAAEAVKPSKIGANIPEDRYSIWEPCVYEKPDGGLGMIIRNSTNMKESHRTILYAESKDNGKTWSKAMPIEVDSVSSREFAASVPGGLYAIANDNHTEIPEHAWINRLNLSLFFTGGYDPNLLLPGPVIQPQGSVGFYPNAIIQDGEMYAVYTYTYGRIYGSRISEIPDLTRPFILPRDSRSGLKLDGRIAHLVQRTDSLGVVLSEALLEQPEVVFSFSLKVNAYDGNHLILLTLGGKTRQATRIRAIYDEKDHSDVIQVRDEHNQWKTLRSFDLQEPLNFTITLAQDNTMVALDSDSTIQIPRQIMRKISFGDLYSRPEWPVGRAGASDVEIDLNSIRIE